MAIVIFDSTAPPRDALAVYVEAVAAELAGTEREAAMEVYTARSEARGLGARTVSDVTMPAAHRLYRATARRHFVLHGDDQHVAIRLRDGGGPAAGRSTSA